MTDIDAELVELEYGPDYDGRDNPCPDCTLGQVESTGVRDVATGLELVACSENCGWRAQAHG